MDPLEQLWKEEQKDIAKRTAERKEMLRAQSEEVEHLLRRMCFALSLRYGDDGDIVEGAKAVEKEFGNVLAHVYKDARELLQTIAWDKG